MISDLCFAMGKDDDDVEVIKGIGEIGMEGQMTSLEGWRLQLTYMDYDDIDFDIPRWNKC